MVKHIWQEVHTSSNLYPRVDIYLVGGPHDFCPPHGNGLNLILSWTIYPGRFKPIQHGCVHSSFTLYPEGKREVNTFFTLYSKMDLGSFGRGVHTFLLYNQGWTYRFIWQGGTPLLPKDGLRFICQEGWEGAHLFYPSLYLGMDLDSSGLGCALPLLPS